MGSFYTNITVASDNVDAIIAALRRMPEEAYVLGPEGGRVVIFPRSGEEQDIDTLLDLSARLSEAATAPALAVLNHDDSVLLYGLADHGEIVDTYDSSPSYFDTGEADSDPSGGDADLLCRTFGATDAAKVEAILRGKGGTEGGFVIEMDRHRELAEILRLPEATVGFGYEYIEAGEKPEGSSMTTLRHVAA